MSTGLEAAFPDLDYHFKILSVEGEMVKTSNQLSGTHTGDFDLTAMGMALFRPAENPFLWLMKVRTQQCAVIRSYLSRWRQSKGVA